METGKCSFTVYVLRCADGAVDKHGLIRRSVRDALVDLERHDENRECGPHVLLSASVSRSPWVMPLGADWTTENIRVKALHNPCPRCNAPAHALCVNLAERRRDVVAFTKWPHSARIELLGRS